MPNQSFTPALHLLLFDTKCPLTRVVFLSSSKVRNLHKMQVRGLSLHFLQLFLAGKKLSLQAARERLQGSRACWNMMAFPKYILRNASAMRYYLLQHTITLHSHNWNTFYFSLFKAWMGYNVNSNHQKNVYSLVPIRRHGSINHHTSFIWPCIQLLIFWEK